MANKLVNMIERQGARYASREALRHRLAKGSPWVSISWEEFAAEVHTAGYALAALGLGEKENIAICSPNTPQILSAEFGVFRNRGAAVPIYAGSSQAQFDFIVTNSRSRIIFVGDKNQYPLALSYARRHPSLLAIVYFAPDLETEPDDTKSMPWSEFLARGAEASDNLRGKVDLRTEKGEPADIATLIYTSGTTGEPKGVLLPHSCYDATLEMHAKLLTQIKDDDVSMSFLPMSHIFEKAWSFFCLYRGLRIAINYDPRYIQETIQEVKPNIMCCVPRFWEKVYTAVRAKLAEFGTFQRLMVARAIKTGKRRNLDYVRLGRPVPKLLEKEYQFWDKKLFNVLKKNIGIPEPNFFPTAGAPLSDKICEFFRSVGIEIMVGYGLSETTATVSCFPQYGYEIGTVGVPLDMVEVRIDSNGEILVKSPSVMAGYYNNPKANAEVFTPDGFFRTGDAGYFTPSGALVLTERVKDLFKTSNGKYIAPQALESRLAEDKFIDEVAVIGDQRKFVTALIVPNFPHLEHWAKEQKIDYADKASLVRNPKVNAFFLKRISAVQKDMAEFEKIKKITLLPMPFSVMNGEVTNTMKVRRNVVCKRYADEIEAMYAEN